MATPSKHGHTFQGLSKYKQLNLFRIEKSEKKYFMNFNKIRFLLLFTVIFSSACKKSSTDSTSTSEPSRWGRRADLLEANSEMSVAELNGQIYVLGGYPSTRISTNVVQVYDPVIDQWRRGTPLPIALNHTMSVSVNGILYVIGGQTEAGGDGPFVNTVYAFDPNRGTWSSRTPMPTARSGGGATVVNGRIYVAGGRPPRGNDFAVYDPATDRWEPLPNLPTQRNHLGIVSVGSKIYVIGGVNAIVAYDFIHVFGGEGNAHASHGVFPDHDVYLPVRNSWIHLPDMPIPVHGVTGAVFINGLINLPGGRTSIGGTSGSTIHQTYGPANSYP